MSDLANTKSPNINPFFHIRPGVLKAGVKLFYVSHYYITGGRRDFCLLVSYEETSQADFLIFYSNNFAYEALKRNSP